MNFHTLNLSSKRRNVFEYMIWSFSQIKDIWNANNIFLWS